MEELKALSLRQKWAWLVARGFKPIENRPVRFAFRGRFLIHASTSTEPLPGTTDSRYGSAWIKERLTDSEWAEYLKYEPAYGAIIGAGTVVDCVDSAVEINRRYGHQYDVRWYVGPHALIVVNAVVFDEPIPCRGMPGFFVPNFTRDGLGILEEQRRKYG